MIDIENRRKSEKVVSYGQIRDLFFFRTIANEYEPSVAKQILPIAIRQLLVSYEHSFVFDHSKYIYISNQNLYLPPELFLSESILKAGHLIPTQYDSILLPHKSKLYCMSHLCEYLLRNLLLHQQVPLTAGMKVFEKFMFYKECSLIDCEFGGFIYRKNSEIDALYYLLEGQISIYSEEKAVIREIARIDSKRLFGLFQLKNSFKLRQFHVKSHRNSTKLLVIPLELIRIFCEQKDIAFQRFINRFNSQLHQTLYHRQLREKARIAKITLNKKIIDQSIKSKDFNLRVNRFESCDKSKKKDPFWQFIQAKKLGFKIQQINHKTKTESQSDNFNPRLSNFSSRTHKNQFLKAEQKENTFYHSCSTTQRFKKIKGSQISFDSKQTGIRSLLKFTAIKKYLGRISKQQQNDVI